MGKKVGTGVRRRKNRMRRIKRIGRSVFHLFGEGGGGLRGRTTGATASGEEGGA
jgi:hypothetical protein